MLQVSYDPDANTTYWYFIELESGQVSADLPYPAALLLDTAGAIIGVRLDLDDEITLDQLELAQSHDGVTLDMNTGYLRICPSGARPARELRLTDDALLDFDAEGRLLGVDVALPEEYGQEALTPLAALLIALEDGEEPQGVPGDGPVVVYHAPVAEPDEDDDEDDEDDEDDDEDDEDDEPVARPAPTKVAAPTEAPEASPAPPAKDSPPTNVPFDATFRSGYAALVGKPNVGKSTLLNRLLGQKVAIVSPRPQTTRVPLRGILNRPSAQVVFIDTPGIHDPRHKLGSFMVELARRAMPSADVICFVVDISKPPSPLDERIAAQVRRFRRPRLLVLNKVDVRLQGQGYLQAFRDLGPWDMEVAVSARTGAGLETLIEQIVERLPLAPPPYPDGQISDQTERQLAAELVREKVLRFIDQEVPHAVAVEVDEWSEREGVVVMRMTINVEKESQKGILIGAGGEMLKRIGTAARKDIEAALGQTIFLELWVKSRPNWRDDPASLGWLGYNSRDWG